MQGGKPPAGARGSFIDREDLCTHPSKGFPIDREGPCALRGFR